MPYARGWHGVNKNTDTTHTCILTVHTHLARTRTGAVSLTDTVSRCRSRSTHYGTSRVDRDVLGDRRLSVSLDRACLARGARRGRARNTLYCCNICITSQLRCHRRTILGLTLGLGLGRVQRRSLHLSLLWLGLPWRGLAKLRKGPLGWRLHGLLLQLHAHVRRDLVRVRVRLGLGSGSGSGLGLGLGSGLGLGLGLGLAVRAVRAATR